MSSGHVNLVNSVLWNNVEDSSPTENDEIILAAGGSAHVFNTCIKGWTGALGGVGNHGNDPNFVDADGPDDIYGTADDNPRLRANSPCIDTGESSVLPPDTFDLDEDGDLTEPLPVDLDFLPRIVGPNVDMGAFEFQGEPCRPDIDGSGVVDVDDLITVVLAWGACTAGEPCPADLDLNMQVEVDDLIAVILNWGACP